MVPSVNLKAAAVLAGRAYVEVPAEVRFRDPVVTVEIVKLPEVLVQEDVPPEAMTRAPVELPRLVAAVPVALMLVVPVTVRPPVPWIKPVPELTPTKVAAPAFVTCQVEDVPKISTPVPELEIAKTAPEAEAYDWVKDRTFPESVQVPAVTVQLEAKVTTGLFTVKVVAAALMVKALDRSKRLPETVWAVV